MQFCALCPQLKNKIRFALEFVQPTYSWMCGICCRIIYVPETAQIKKPESSSQQLPTSSRSLTKCGNAHLLSTCWNYVCHDPLQVLCVLSTSVSLCVQLFCCVQKTMSSYSHPHLWLSHSFHPLCLTDLSGKRVFDGDVPPRAENSAVSSSLQHRELILCDNHHVLQPWKGMTKLYFNFRIIFKKWRENTV